MLQVYKYIFKKIEVKNIFIFFLILKYKYLMLPWKYNKIYISLFKKGTSWETKSVKLSYQLFKSLNFQTFKLTWCRFLRKKFGMQIRKN